MRCPLVLVRGSESQLLAAEAARSLIDSQPKGRLIEISGAGHHVAIDRPDELVSVLTEFIGLTQVPRLDH